MSNSLERRAPRSNWGAHLSAPQGALSWWHTSKSKHAGSSLDGALELLWRRDDLDVVERGALVSVRDTFDADHVSWAQNQSFDLPPRGRVRSHARTRKIVVRQPLVHHTIAYQDVKFRYAFILIEVLNIDFVPSGGPRKPKCDRALLRGRRALDGFARTKQVRIR